MIIAKVAEFLRACAKAEARLSDEQIERFGDLAKDAVRKHFGRVDADLPPTGAKTTIRASTLGRPICQQQMGYINAPAEEPSPFEHFKLAYGDLVEALASVILEGSGVAISGYQQGVSLVTDHGEFTGTYDFLIDGKIYDFKTASDWSFNHKFVSEGLATEIGSTGSDELGYGIQGQFYQQASGYPFAGWLVVNKSTGEWTYAPIQLPASSDGLHRRISELVQSRNPELCDVVEGGEDPSSQDINPYGITRIFSAVDELYRKKPTGNKLLPNGCTFCKYKRACWAGLEYRPALKSEAKNPPYRYYVSVNVEENNEG